MFLLPLPALRPDLHRQGIRQWSFYLFRDILCHLSSNLLQAVYKVKTAQIKSQKQKYKNYQ